jgi:hypothetical protein
MFILLTEIRTVEKKQQILFNSEYIREIHPADVPTKKIGCETIIDTINGIHSVTTPFQELKELLLNNNNVKFIFISLTQRILGRTRTEPSLFNTKYIQQIRPVFEILEDNVKTIIESDDGIYRSTNSFQEVKKLLL